MATVHLTESIAEIDNQNKQFPCRVRPSACRAPLVCMCVGIHTRVSKEGSSRNAAQQKHLSLMKQGQCSPVAFIEGYKNPSDGGGTATCTKRAIFFHLALSKNSDLLD